MNFLCYTTKITCQGERRIYVNRCISCDKKDKTVYYRSNITHKGRHISLGSFPTEVQAHQAYTAACELLCGTETIDEAFYRITSLPLKNCFADQFPG